MKLPIYQVDAFASQLFSGNPAAVVMLQKYLSSEQMQSIAMENNLSETAFLMAKDNGYEIRWFTPTVEVDLCGHATLAAAFVVLNFYNSKTNSVKFYSLKSGVLNVDRVENQYIMDFPIAEFSSTSLPKEIEKALGVNAVEVYKGKDDYMVVVGSEEEVRQMQPDFRKLLGLNTRGVIVTAKGKKVDFISRFFAPAAGIDEDPVTGSAHILLMAYWAQKLGRQKLTAFQASQRGGELNCVLDKKKVKIGGKAQLYLKGEIYV